MDPVAITGLLVAAQRAEESQRDDRLFSDPFAATLSGDTGRAVLQQYRAAAAGTMVPFIEVRTRWYDDAIARAVTAGIRQFVILAAGMDARSYRLAWPERTRVFEIDQPEVIAFKARMLSGAATRCTRVPIARNLLEDWPAELDAHGFDRQLATGWLVEGLLSYLERTSIDAILARLDALSRPGSVVLYDVLGRSLLESSTIANTLQMMRELGAPWQFGTDDPASLMPGAWETSVTEPAVVGNQWKRWPFPAAPPGVPGVPRGYLIEGRKP